MIDRMQAGTVPPKPHTVLRDADGHLNHEECLTRDGFDGPFTILYHRERPHVAMPANAAHGWEIPSRADDEPITLRTLLVMEFDALGLDAFGSKITLFGGPEARLRKSAVEMLALATHELLTNAIKYGAFASESGRLSVTWRIEGMPPDQQLVLEWIECGIASPAPAADPKRNGYGRTLIEEALPYSLSAETTFELGADNLRCRIRLPLTPHDANKAHA